MADHVVVIARGRLIADGSIEELSASSTDVFVRCSDPTALAARLNSAGATAAREGADALAVTGMSTDDVGRAAFDGGIAVWELLVRRASLEETFMKLTGDGQEFAFGEAS